KIPRTIIRKVVSECVTCIQAQPLKTKEKLVHITACRPMERIQIDLIDMRRYRNSNGMTSCIMTVVDVCSKFAWAFPLAGKTGKEVAATLKSLFFNIGPP
ncbi:SCAN domain-containing protein 3, partial [Nosema granulosis]